MLLIAAIFMTFCGFSMLFTGEGYTQAYCLYFWMIAFFLWMILLRRHDI